MLARTNADFSQTFNIKNEDGTPFDLTGLSLIMQGKLHRGHAADWEASTDNGKLNPSDNPALGNLTLSLTGGEDGDDLTDLRPGNYRFDLKTDTDQFIFAGILPVVSGVTNDATRSLPSGMTDGDGIDVIAATSPGITVTLVGTTVVTGFPVGPEPSDDITVPTPYIDEADMIAKIKYPLSHPLYPGAIYWLQP